MGWGVLDDQTGQMPPGTVLLNERLKGSGSVSVSDKPEAPLKKDGDIVLQPQPSDSPNDPYNWSAKRKYLQITLLIIMLVAVGGTQGMLTTGQRKLAEQYKVKFPVIVATLRPPTAIGSAIGLFLASAISAVWGKRILFVAGILVVWIHLLFGFYANSLTYYKVLNFFGGLASAPLELLVAPMFTELIFVHQRGRVMATSAVLGVVGSDASHVIAGNIIQRLGIKYTFLISFAVFSPLVVLIYLFVWETTFDRERYERRQQVGIIDFNHSILPADEEKPRIIVTETTMVTSSVLGSEKFLEPKWTFRQQIKIYRGRVSDRNFFKALVQPFPLLLFPSVIFATIVNGAFVTWLSVASVTRIQVISFPPYNLSPAKLAYIGLPGSIVALFASVGSGLLSDKSIQYMSRRNGGIYEPEFRLLLMIPAVLFSTLGFLTLGQAYAQKASVVKLVALELFFQIGSPFASSASITYVFDCLGNARKNTTTEAFVAASLFRALFSAISSVYVPAWFARVGPINCYTTLAVLNLCFAALTIPMYIFGKRMRGALSRNSILMNAAMH